MQSDPGGPRAAQESPGEARRVQKSLGEARGAQNTLGELRRAQESSEQSRRGQGGGSEQPRRAQERPGEFRTAQEGSGELRTGQVWYGMVWYGLNGAGRRPTHHLGSGRGQSPPGGPFLLPSGGPQIWGQPPRPARPALPLGTVAGSEFTGSPPPPTRTPSRKGALDSRPTGPSPRLPRGGSEVRPAICQFVVTPTATSAAPPLALRLWRLGTALGARAR